jgi:NAD(P)-dependent dehydrogenase (short-subunit alcohol dehydrogenase family)
MTLPSHPMVAVVTGAGSGIGRATTLRLAADGATVLAADVDGASAQQTVQLAGQAPGRVQAAALDVTDETAVRALFESVPGRFAASLTTLVNVAGTGCTTNAPDTPLAVWNRVLGVNASGTFLCCKHAIPRMIANGGGSVTNIASVAGLVGLRNRAAYCASKGAVIALTRALAVDHVNDRVRVNCVCPGTIASPWVRRLIEDAGEDLLTLEARQPMGRLGHADEIAEAVAYLAGDRSAFVTGSALVVDGGLTAA